MKMKIACNECGFVGNAKIIITERADESYGEIPVCPKCESVDIKTTSQPRITLLYEREAAKNR